MALGALSLSINAGRKGRPFEAKLYGLTTGKVEIVGNDGTPGFWIANGRVYHSGLPYDDNVLVIREYDPGAATSVRETRIPITAYEGLSRPNIDAAVPAAATGALFDLIRALGPASSFSLRSGSDANLSITGTQISATAGLSAGTSQIALISETLGAGNDARTVNYRVTLTGAANATSGGGGVTPTYGTPVLNGTLTQGVAASGASISGLTAGSTYTLNIAGLSVTGSGATRMVSGTATASGALSGTESGLPGYTDKTTALGNVAPAVTPTLPVLRTAIQRVQANTGRAVIEMNGTSIFAGAGAAPNTGNGAGASATAVDFSTANALPRKMAAAFSAAGIPARADAVWGNHNFGSGGNAQPGAANPQLVTTGTWSVTSTTLGNKMFLCAAAGSTITFTPEFPTNRLDLWVVKSNLSGSAAVTDGSGSVTSPATVSFANSATTFEKISITRTANTTDSFTLTTQDTKNVQIAAFIPWSTVNYRLEIHNQGWSGATSSLFMTTSQPYSQLNAIGAVLPVDLIVGDMVINDQVTGVATATTQANLTTYANAAKATGADVLLYKPHKASDPAVNSYLTPATLATIDAATAATGLAAPIDVFNNVNLSLAGGDYYDPIHLSGQGNNTVALYLVAQLRSRAGF